MSDPSPSPTPSLAVTQKSGSGNFIFWGVAAVLITIVIFSFLIILARWIILRICIPRDARRRRVQATVAPRFASMNILSSSSITSRLNRYTPQLPMVFVPIPSFPYAKPSETQDSDDNTCSICINDYQVNEELRALPCAHVFHRDCIDPWLKGKPTCPLCKLDLVEEAVSVPSDTDIPSEPTGTPNGIWVRQPPAVVATSPQPQVTTDVTGPMTGPPHLTTVILEPVTSSRDGNNIVLIVR
mmetsp:Transcript_30893/g.49984  ORF Transcript_30893/g.49984 Transcript_30893/m.49984 type:complete len:241 (+) Transcript_30893:164-886(+)